MIIMAHQLAIMRTFTKVRMRVTEGQGRLKGIPQQTKISENHVAIAAAITVTVR